MKKIFALFFLLLSSAPLYAEYSGYHIQFTIEHVNGKVSKGYCYITASYFDMDSLNNGDWCRLFGSL